MKTLYPFRSEGYEEVLVAGRFAADAADPPSVVEGEGKFTVVHTSTGLFTATISDQYAGIVSVVASLQLATPATRCLLCEVTGNNTFTVTVVDEADTEADLAASEADSIGFILVARKGRAAP